MLDCITGFLRKTLENSIGSQSKFIFCLRINVLEVLTIKIQSCGSRQFRFHIYLAAFGISILPVLSAFNLTTNASVILTTLPDIIFLHASYSSWVLQSSREVILTKKIQNNKRTYVERKKKSVWRKLMHPFV